MSVIEYRTPDGKVKTLGKFGESTQKEFDDALAVLPELIEMARIGNEEAGQTANDILWGLANESVNTRITCPVSYKALHLFGNKECKS